VTFGRPSLFQRLTIAHGKQAVSASLCGSGDFKTWSKWFIHSMYFADGAKNLIQDWLQLWRPIVARRSGQRLSPGDQEPLFIDASGKQIEHWSRVLSLLWERTFGRSMNVTILRYWKATMVALRAETEDERKLVFEADCHSVQVTKKFYCKVFSLMDAKKAKDRTDVLCNLQMATSWSLLPPVETVAEAGSGSSDSASDSASEDGAPAAASGSSKKKSKKNKHGPKGRRALVIRGGPWCQADELLLIRAHEAHIPNTYGKWVGILDTIKHELQEPNRTPENLKDKYRNLQKHNAHLCASGAPQEQNRK
jgi:hypothetical protein